MDQIEPRTGGATGRVWPYSGCSLDDLHHCRPEDIRLAEPAPDEVIARVEAVSICSSDVKIVRLGADHPLFSQRERTSPAILGHEVCLRVHAIGRDQAHRFRRGQRLALQPAMNVNGKRRIIGMDLPGGFAQFLVLGPEALADYVFDVPETLPAAAISLLEPYACVERAFRPNCRQEFDPNGRALIVLGDGAETYDTDRNLSWRETLRASARAADGRTTPRFLESLNANDVELADLPQQSFDDIVALGEIDALTLSRLPALMADGGLLLQARRTPVPPVSIDPARVHYNALAFVGTQSTDFTEALLPQSQRFDVRPGGVALVHGAGGAMGRIHVHRLLQLDRGPSTIIATSRKGRRLDDLRKDFEPLARKAGRTLMVLSNDDLDKELAEVAPGGLNDAIVVAPDVEAIAAVADTLAPDGLLSIFAGFPFGGAIDFDLSSIAVTGKRLTGSTGCTVGDMKDVLDRVLAGELDLMANIRAVAGLDALPDAFVEVSQGIVSGKIVIFPQKPDEPLRHLKRPWSKEDETALT